MKIRFPQWEHKVVVFAAVQLEDVEGLATAVYHNGVHIMDLEVETGFETSFALGQEHVDFLDTIGEEGWELVSHTVSTTNVVLDAIAYPEFRHYFTFKRRYPFDKVLDEEEVEGTSNLTLLRVVPGTAPADPECLS